MSLLQLRKWRPESLCCHGLKWSLRCPRSFILHEEEKQQMTSLISLCPFLEKKKGNNIGKNGSTGRGKRERGRRGKKKQREWQVLRLLGFLRVACLWVTIKPSSVMVWCTLRHLLTNRDKLPENEGGEEVGENYLPPVRFDFRESLPALKSQVSQGLNIIFELNKFGVQHCVSLRCIACCFDTFICCYMIAIVAMFITLHNYSTILLHLYDNVHYPIH